jgi:hypothetical protein
MATSNSPNLKTLECLCVKAITPQACLDAVTFSLYTDPDGDSNQNAGGVYTIVLDSGVDIQDIGILDTASITYDGNTYNYIVAGIDRSVITLHYVSSTNNADTPVNQLCTGDDCKPSIIFCCNKVRSSGGFVKATINCDPAVLHVGVNGVGAINFSPVKVVTFPIVSQSICTTEDISFTITPVNTCDPESVAVYTEPGDFIGEISANTSEINIGDDAKVEFNNNTYNYLVTNIEDSTLTVRYISTSEKNCTSQFISFSVLEHKGGTSTGTYVTSPVNVEIEGYVPGSILGAETSNVVPEEYYVMLDVEGNFPFYSPSDESLFFTEDNLETGTVTDVVSVGDIASIKFDEDNTYTYEVQSVGSSDSQAGSFVKLKFLSSTSGENLQLTSMNELPLKFCNPDAKVTRNDINTSIGDLCTPEDEAETCSPLISFCYTVTSPNPDLAARSSISALLSCSNVRSPVTLSATPSITATLVANYSVRQTIIPLGAIATYADKFAGDFGDFECEEKLYPSGDLEIDSGMDQFVGPHNQSGNLYTFIDEGIFTGDNDKKFGQSVLISDDKNSFIHPDTIHTDGLAQYKCNLTNFRVRPDQTRFRVRASAPISNYEADVPPRYTINEIKFQDPSGNLIVQYDDIVLKGDADYNSTNYVNFGTYSSNASINLATDYYDWDRESPFLHEISGYTLSFNVKSEALDDAFDTGFSTGFEENRILHDTYASGDDYLALDGAPLSTQDQSLINPTKNLRISAIEICNSGGHGPRIESYVKLFAEVDEKGHRVERKILPSFMPLFDFDTGIYPSVSSIWYHNNNSEISNLDSCGSDEILKGLRQESEHEYAILNSVGPHLDSGKLTLKFSHHHGNVNEITKGSFDCGFDQGLCSNDFWTDPSGSFNTQNRNPQKEDDGFFVVESISLKVKAKKAAGTRDYILDAVGYSDDKLLNVTSASGGFLQGPSGYQITNIFTTDNTISRTGIFPIGSGFSSINDLGISTESISEKEAYFEASGNENAGGDHYFQLPYPVVTSTEFQDYEVPLKIYDERVALGKSRDYSMSSLFEHLYLDIYPLPSGASIASIYLLVRYAPQNALNLSIDGGEKLQQIEDGRTEGKIFPVSRQSNDNILNAGSGFVPLSTIENIPHAYTTPSSIKSNYSRRWRGMEGTVQGPFDVDVFGFGFENPPLDFPFLSGFYDFDYRDGLYIKSRPLNHDKYTGSSYDSFGQVSGLISSEPEIFKNIGWRFSSGVLFDDELPGYSGSYMTSDWTSLSNGSYNLQTHELYGQISDAFNNIIRISGHNTNINFGHIETTSGFSIFTRFTPDANVSGIDYNLFNSGVLFSKWENSSELDFALGYDDGYLCGYAKDSDGNLITVKDTIRYSGYQFPLSVLLTYNDHQSSGLKLYTDNELYSGDFTTLRASSVPFYKNETSADLVLGHCAGSGVGMNMLVSEFGISAYTSGVRGSGTNIVELNPDPTYKQVTAQKFLENHRVKFFEPNQPYDIDSYKLWDYVNEDTYSDWTIGDFKYCSFSQAFSHLTKRTGRDLISHNIKHDGSGYISRNDLLFPSTIDSGVSYHTQIENDFLRFHLSDTTDNFYSTHRRITKDLPRGYKFEDRALVVETVIEHKTDHDIIWPDCTGTVGPKLIVSLYTTKQEPYWSTDQPNWGLINRDIHYLEPSSCLMRLDSKFTYDSLINESEDWSIFPVEPRARDFEERYFSQDVDDMFLQYDLVYPSGPSFESRINVHTAHVRMDDAYVNTTINSGILNVISSGGNVVSENLNLSVPIVYNVSGSPPLNLNVLGPSGLISSGFMLYASGLCRADSSLNLQTISYLPASSTLNFNVSGAGPTSHSGIFNLFTSGFGMVSSDMPLSITNLDTTHVPGFSPLELFTWASSPGSTGILQSMPTFIQNTHIDLVNEIAISSGGPFSLVSLGSSPLVNRNPDATMSIFMDTPPQVSSSLNLTLYGDNIFTTAVSSSGFTLNIGGELSWFNKNLGTAIELEDNSFASLSADNEIRGVDLIGYGPCDGDGLKKAVDPAVITDETAWRPETCNDAGIFRAISTYTNPTASGFGETVGYSGNYYGIRKFSGLTPSVPFLSTLKITTGFTDAIKVPRNFEDWEYGICGPSFGTSGCCTADCDQDLAYSGVKLIGDYPYLSGDATITSPSGRNVGDNYGKAVAVVDDLMAVGSPFVNIPDENDNAIVDAGAIYLYRRDEDVAGKKASWQMEDKLMLPPRQRRDFISKTVEDLIVYDTFSISGQKWNIGQEGRRLGDSVDICSSGDRETIVAGAPYAAWTREFPELTAKGLPIYIMVFTDKFDLYGNKRSVQQGNSFSGSLGGLARLIGEYNTLYKYFAAPWNATGDEFQADLQIKANIFQFSFSKDVDSRQPIDTKKDWLKHKHLERMDDRLLEDKREVYNGMLSGVIESFFELFPTGQNLPHSGIPPIIGIFQEQSASAGLGAYLRDNIAEEGVANVVSDFIHFYKEHSKTSGVVYPTIVEGAVNKEARSGFVKQIFGESEKWHESVTQTMTTVLDTGFLVENEQVNFITSGVGQDWAVSYADEFQIPPTSGGRVYIFEKENGKFNCVQELKSFSDRILDYNNLFWPSYSDQYVDRYGHSVSISKNSEVIAVGSPYTEFPCEIYERNDDENQRMYTAISGFLEHAGLTNELVRYGEITKESGITVAQTVTYDELSHDDKFQLRTDQNFWGGDTIQLYKPVFNYTYDDIETTGTWGFIPTNYLGTSRLGYSVSVNDEGNTVAFGAPTDSMNLFEDTNVWYAESPPNDGLISWGSYTNAGAVRIFEAKKYYPHSGVVEFTRFGNLDRSIHNEERNLGFYDQMGLYFLPDEIPARRTKFEEIEIPTDVGLSFIITPELDAASDEIIDNIKSWLALGDRTLVLVGNDPVYEENGLYKESNEIINKILKKLGSRMRIHAADTEIESLPECSFNEYNVTAPRKVPHSHYSSIDQSNIYAKGVGDIRIDLSDLGLEDVMQFSPCDTDETERLNHHCKLPIKHNGDLRAGWLKRCGARGGGGIDYEYNWPFHFANPHDGSANSNGQSCENYPENPHPLISRPNEDIVPLLAAAEIKKGEFWFIPEYVYEAYSYTKPVYEEFERTGIDFKFAESQLDELSFSIHEDENSNLVLSEGAVFDAGTFDNPPKENGRNGLLQSTGKEFDYTFGSYEEDVRLEDDSVLMVQERYFDKDLEGSDIRTDSTVIMIATLASESQWSFGLLGDRSSENNDENNYFYVNLVMNSCEQASHVAQIGGWTGRSSFGAASEDSALAERLSAYSITITENALYGQGDSENEFIPDYIDVVWIANPLGRPSQQDIDVLKLWLNPSSEVANKKQRKLIITYSADKYDAATEHGDKIQEIASNVDYICDALNITSKPVKKTDETYFVHPEGIFNSAPGTSDLNEAIVNRDGYLDPNTGKRIAPQILDPNSPIFKGCVHTETNISEVPVPTTTTTGPPTDFVLGGQETVKLLGKDDQSLGSSEISYSIAVTVSTAEQLGFDIATHKYYIEQNDKEIKTYEMMIPTWEEQKEYIVGQGVPEAVVDSWINDGLAYLVTLKEDSASRQATIDSINAEIEALNIVKEQEMITTTTVTVEKGYGFYAGHQHITVDDPTAPQPLPPCTSVHRVVFWGIVGIGGSTFIPISPGTDPEREVQKIIYYPFPCVEQITIVPNKQYIDAEASITFPTLPGTGYRLFINWVSETPYENVEVNPHLDRITTTPSDYVFNVETEQLDLNVNLLPGNKMLPEVCGAYCEKPAADIRTIEFDFRAMEDTVTLTFDTLSSTIERLGIFPDGKYSYINDGIIPKTPRILSVSGCPLETVAGDGAPYTVREETGVEEVFVPEMIVPGRQGVHPDMLRPISHSSMEYCNPDNTNCSKILDVEIEDGPIVVAEEFEHFSSFANGYERSRIVVITDSTIIQGQCPEYREEALDDNQKFIRSLYPVSPDIRSSTELGFDFYTESPVSRQFQFTQKIRSPEHGSPAKYYAASGLGGTLHMFGTGVHGSLNNYIDNEDTYHPANPGFSRDATPNSDKKREQKTQEFMTEHNPYNIYPRFSGDFLNTGAYIIGSTSGAVIVDAGLGGGIPDLMKITGKDYLDFDIYNSGCPGDLFGYSVDLTQTKLIVGTPFNAFHIENAISGVSGLVPWASISGDNNPSRSGLTLSANGGAGAAFYFERTGSGSNIVSEYLPWEFKQKIKPSSVNVGIDTGSVSDLEIIKGSHSLNADFVQDHAHYTDKFGYSVAIDADMIAVGAPNHDFETQHDFIYESGGLQRKSFNAEFDIPGHRFYDLGGSGVRFDQFGGGSGNMVLNNGAVFTFRHEVINWQEKTKEWIYAEKLYPQGYNDRTQSNPSSSPLISGCENDFFGTSVSLYRTKRGDSDYTLTVGAPHHDFSTSGNHSTSGLLEAGATYTYDAMLREQIPAIPNTGSFIDVEVFGDRSNAIDKIKTRVYQNKTGDPITYITTGIVFSNKDGNIFIEGSGFDPAPKGFILHRPFVESVVGDQIIGTLSTGVVSLFTEGMPATIDNAWPSLVSGLEFDNAYTLDFPSMNKRPSGMSLFISGPDSAIVYNNMGLYSTSWTTTQAGSGTDPLLSGLLLTVSGANPTSDSGIMNISLSGTIEKTDNLNLRVRGV